MHELADGGVVDVLGGRDEGDAPLTQICHDDGVIESVACHTGQLVDDDVVDIASAPNTLEHSLEGNPFRHLSGRASWLDVFIDDGQAELFCLALASDSLRRNGVAFGVVVGFDLSRR
nr:hypothetical protein [Nocardia macrotermitis]